jgi:hypothetical protein
MIDAGLRTLAGSTHKDRGLVADIWLDMVRNMEGPEFPEWDDLLERLTAEYKANNGTLDGSWVPLNPDGLRARQVIEGQMALIFAYATDSVDRADYDRLQKDYDDERVSCNEQYATIVELEKLVGKLFTALEAAGGHLDYCGYGDRYERECAKDAKLPEQVEEALEAGRLSGRVPTV